MKALSIHPVPAMMIFAKEKTVEIRSWGTSYRGDILICSTRQKIKDTIPGHTLCVVTLTDVRPLSLADMEPAKTSLDDFKAEKLNYLDFFGWHLENVRYIRPVPVKGKLGLWNYTGEIEYLREPETDAEDEKIYHEIYEPLFI